MVQTDFGGPEVVRLRHVEEPTPGAGEAVIRVGACGLNRLDAMQRRGPAVLPGFQLPHIPGMDIAGTVVAVGPADTGDRAVGDVAVADVAVGDRVVVDPTQGCGRCGHCRAGDAGYCPELRIIGGNVPGGLAEYVAVPTDSLVRIPDGVSLAAAATLPTAWATAWHAVQTVARVAPGECLVVQAGGSALSLAAIALAHRAGAPVVAAASSDAKLAVARAAGADLVVRNDAGLVAAVQRMTGGRGGDVVIDHVGADKWDESLACLGIRGRMVLVGNTTGDRVSLSLADVFHRGLQLLGAGAYTRDDFVRAVSIGLAERLFLPTAAEYPLEDLAEAWSTLESRATVGKVVVQP